MNVYIVYDSNMLSSGEGKEGRKEGRKELGRARLLYLHCDDSVHREPYRPVADETNTLTSQSEPAGREVASRVLLENSSAFAEAQTRFSHDSALSHVKKRKTRKGKNAQWNVVLYLDNRRFSRIYKKGELIH